MEPSLDYVDETDEKCLVFVSKKIYGFCGSSTSALQRKAASRLTKFMQTRKGLTEDDVTTFFGTYLCFRSLKLILFSFRVNINSYQLLFVTDRQVPLTFNVFVYSHVYK